MVCYQVLVQFTFHQGKPALVSTHIKKQNAKAFLVRNSAWQTDTIHHVITALGYRNTGGLESLKNLSSNLADCAKHGADGGFPGFTYYSDTLAFFRRNREDIIKNLELLAGELGQDIISMVQGFGVFRHETPPTAASIGQALWGMGKLKDDLTSLYNVFAWFALEEISRVWFRYLEDNPAYYAELSA
jgi:hypothetical protein